MEWDACFIGYLRIWDTEDETGLMDKIIGERISFSAMTVRDLEISIYNSGIILQGGEFQCQEARRVSVIPERQEYTRSYEQENQRKSG